MQQVLVRLPKDMYQQLKDQADSEDRTLAAEMRRAIRGYLEAKRQPTA
jgi:predicted DNA-binding protein